MTTYKENNWFDWFEPKETNKSWFEPEPKSINVYIHPAKIRNLEKENKEKEKKEKEKKNEKKEKEKYIINIVRCYVRE